MAHLPANALSLRAYKYRRDWVIKILTLQNLIVCRILIICKTDLASNNQLLRYRNGHFRAFLEIYHIPRMQYGDSVSVEKLPVPTFWQMLVKMWAQILKGIWQVVAPGRCVWNSTEITRKKKKNSLKVMSKKGHLQRKNTCTTNWRHDLRQIFTNSSRARTRTTYHAARKKHVSAHDARMHEHVSTHFPMTF